MLVKEKSTAPTFWHQFVRSASVSLVFTSAASGLCASVSVRCPTCWLCEKHSLSERPACVCCRNRWQMRKLLRHNGWHRASRTTLTTQQRTKEAWSWSAVIYTNTAYKNVYGGDNQQYAAVTTVTTDRTDQRVSLSLGRAEMIKNSYRNRRASEKSQISIGGRVGAWRAAQRAAKARW